jgi:hypothetical protein
MKYANDYSRAQIVELVDQKVTELRDCSQGFLTYVTILGWVLNYPYLKSPCVWCGVVWCGVGCVCVCVYMLCVFKEMPSSHLCSSILCLLLTIG